MLNFGTFKVSEESWTSQTCSRCWDKKLPQNNLCSFSSISDKFQNSPKGFHFWDTFVGKLVAKTFQTTTESGFKLLVHEPVPPTTKPGLL